MTAQPAVLPAVAGVRADRDQVEGLRDMDFPGWRLRIFFQLRNQMRQTADP